MRTYRPKWLGLQKIAHWYTHVDKHYPCKHAAVKPAVCSADFGLNQQVIIHTEKFNMLCRVIYRRHWPCRLTLPWLQRQSLALSLRCALTSNPVFRECIMQQLCASAMPVGCVDQSAVLGCAMLTQDATPVPHAVHIPAIEAWLN